MNINPEIIGFIAGGMSSALFIPQIIKIIKEKSAEEIALLTCIIGVVSSGLWLW
ncbi:MAG: PQ-loop repeat-containing protein, partial [Chryseobacterium sp.]|nr:PQ-loop repeat-containing protein [Chryseobacterium sp.]